MQKEVKKYIFNDINLFCDAVFLKYICNTFAVIVQCLNYVLKMFYVLK
jgi:hypothetical protein